MKSAAALPPFTSGHGLHETKKSNMMDSILEQHTMQLNQAKFADDDRAEIIDLT